MIQIPTSTSIELLLDTNVAVAFLNDPATALARIGPLAKLAVPIIVFGELFYGAENSASVAQNLLKVERLVQRVRVVPFDLDTARYVGRIRHDLRILGKPIPANDIWIAAAALQHQLPLITRDKHFESIDQLQIIEW